MARHFARARYGPHYDPFLRCRSMIRPPPARVHDQQVRPRARGVTAWERRWLEPAHAGCAGFMEWISPTLTRLRRGPRLPSRDWGRQRDEPSPVKVPADG